MTYRTAATRALLASAAILAMPALAQETDPTAAAAAAAAGGGPVLLTEANWMPEVVRVEFRELDPDTVVLLGGSSVLTDGLLREVRRMLTMDWPRPVA